MTTANDIIETLASMQDEEQRRQLCRFFKTGKGEYGEGDRFLGLRVPQTRSVVRAARHDVPLNEVEKLLASEWHEARLCGLLILVDEMKAALPTKRKSGNARRRQEIADFYLLHARRANNWDLVDLSCPHIIGNWLLYPGEDGTMPSRDILDRLAHSDNLWEQRFSIVSNWTLIRADQYDDTLRIATTLLHHRHDLIHKAVGWMLREVGKRDIEVLRGFLEQYAWEMPRTALRYAVEKMDAVERMMWMNR